MSCKCQHCGNKYKVDLNIPDDLWEKIRNGKNLLCGQCIAKAIESLGKYGAYEIGTVDRIRKNIKPFIVSRPNGGCQVLFPLAKLDELLEN